MEDNKFDFYGNQGTNEQDVTQINEKAGNYVGGIVSENNGIQENVGTYVGGVVSGNGQPKEDAGSIAGALEQPGFGIGFGQGFGGIQSNNTQNISDAGFQDGYVGGFIGNNQLQTTENAGLPAKPTLWTKIKSFLFQEVDLKQQIVVKLTPREEKILGEVHDFLFQEITFKSIKNLFKFGKK